MGKFFGVPLSIFCFVKKMSGRLAFIMIERVYIYVHRWLLSRDLVYHLEICKIFLRSLFIFEDSRTSFFLVKS